MKYFVLSFLAISLVAAQAQEWLMPRDTDRTSMWWKDGFPGTIDGAPWHRCIETGHYRFDLDTERLQVLQLGALGSAAPADLELSLTVDGTRYRCTSGGPWTRYTGPRLVESGRFFQRADVTDLVFESEEGGTLNVEARFETAAWSDRLSMILAARPGVKPIEAGDGSFGRVRGGFGLDGENRFEIPAADELSPGTFTIEFWAFVPTDYKAAKHSPWLLCKNRNEVTSGNYGVVLGTGGSFEARMNFGGGKDHAHTIRPERKNLEINAWNHLALSYDGETARLYANGQFAAEEMIGAEFPMVPGAIAFGQRQDGLKGYAFRGVIDEVRLYDRALSLGELRQHRNQPENPPLNPPPLKQWTFQEDLGASLTQLSETWESASLEVTLKQGEKTLRCEEVLDTGETWTAPTWKKAALVVNPSSFSEASPVSLQVTASELATGEACDVSRSPDLGWHRINLDKVVPIAPSGDELPTNDSLERVKLTLTNPHDGEQTARLMFEKTRSKQRLGSWVTGISAILRDPDGEPLGIPVQLSKNWHSDREGGVYATTWFHGISEVRLPANSTRELELTIAYGHWGGVPAVSHAQLSLIGWGSNQLWEQSAQGAWGESICFEPAQAQANCTITDVRPLMVGKEWSWTPNVGAGDFFRFFDPAGDRVPHAAMRPTRLRQGPCLTEVTYSGQVGQTGIDQSSTVSIARTDDITRGTYRLRMDVNQLTEFSRFVIFQIGADTYNSSIEKKMAIGDETGVIREWDTQWGGNVYRTEPLECVGETPWASLHEGVFEPTEKFPAWANRGFVIREWNAQLGGKRVNPWLAERGVTARGKETSTMDILPPPGVTKLVPGDFIEATIEHVILPQHASDYYGPNEPLREALEALGNQWKMVQREAIGNHRKVETTKGEVIHSFPDVRITAVENSAEFTVEGGHAFVPITITGLTRYDSFTLEINGEEIDQSVHGSDFWQTDYDSESGTWSRTYTSPLSGEGPHEIRFR